MNATPTDALTDTAMGEIALAEVLDYSRCPLKWFLEHRAGLVGGQTPQHFAEAGARQALGFYYAGYVEALEDGLLLVWKDWCEEWGAPTKADDLVRYARTRNKVLGDFERGVHRTRSGELYRVPTLTRVYRDALHRAGLIRLGEELDAFAVAQGVVVARDAETVGSVFADALADSLRWMQRPWRGQSPALPAREAVLGQALSFSCDLGGGQAVRAVADLVLRAPDGEDPVWLEVHEFRSLSGMRLAVAGRDLRVAAALHSTRTAADVAWRGVAQVTFRYWPGAEAYTFWQAGSGHLHGVLSAAGRAFAHGLGVPRWIEGYDACRGCGYLRSCWGEQWDSLPLTDAGLARALESNRALETKRALEAKPALEEV